MSDRAFVEDFHRRRRHVRRYLSMVSRIERETRHSTRLVDTDRLHIVRAGLFLILYNLIEASARGAIEAVHDDMTTNRVSFARLSPTVRREVVKGFKRNAKPDDEGLLADLPIDFVAVSLDVDHQFSGNVDARLIREIADLYGFSGETNSAQTRDGADLLTVKTNRNDLAHGRKTYDEVGRSFVARDLVAIATRSMGFVEAILANISGYIDTQAYCSTE